MCEHFDTLTETKSCFKISLGRSIRQLWNKAKLMRHRGGQEKVVRFQSNVVVVLNRRMCEMCDAALPDCQDKEDAGCRFPQGWLHQFCWAAGEKLLLLAHGPHSWDESLTNPWKLVNTGQLYSLGTTPVECVQPHFRHNKFGGQICVQFYTKGLIQFLACDGLGDTSSLVQSFAFLWSPSSLSSAITRHSASHKCCSLIFFCFLRPSAVKLRDENPGDQQFVKY